MLCTSVVNNNSNNNNNNNKNTVDHRTSGWPILATNEYLMSHYRVCALLHYSICKSLGIEMTDKWRARAHKPVTEHEGVSVLWNEGEQTGREGTVNRPDIVIKNKKKRKHAY